MCVKGKNLRGLRNEISTIKAGIMREGRDGTEPRCSKSFLSHAVEGIGTREGSGPGPGPGLWTGRPGRRDLGSGVRVDRAVGGLRRWNMSPGYAACRSWRLHGEMRNCRRRVPGLYTLYMFRWIVIEVGVET